MEVGLEKHAEVSLWHMSCHFLGTLKGFRDQMRINWRTLEKDSITGLDGQSMWLKGAEKTEVWLEKVYHQSDGNF